MSAPARSRRVSGSQLGMSSYLLSTLAPSLITLANSSCCSLSCAPWAVAKAYTRWRATSVSRFSAGRARPSHRPRSRRNSSSSSSRTRQLIPRPVLSQGCVARETAKQGAVVLGRAMERVSGQASVMSRASTADVLSPTEPLLAFAAAGHHEDKPGPAEAVPRALALGCHSSAAPRVPPAHLLRAYRHNCRPLARRAPRAHGAHGRPSGPCTHGRAQGKDGQGDCATAEWHAHERQYQPTTTVKQWSP